MFGVSLSLLPVALQSLLIFLSPVRKGNCSLASTDARGERMQSCICAIVNGSSRQNVEEHCGALVSGWPMCHLPS